MKTPLLIANVCASFQISFMKKVLFISVKKKGNVLEMFKRSFIGNDIRCFFMGLNYYLYICAFVYKHKGFSHPVEGQSSCYLAFIESFRFLFRDIQRIELSHV